MYCMLKLTWPILLAAAAADDDDDDDDEVLEMLVCLSVGCSLIRRHSWTY